MARHFRTTPNMPTLAVQRDFNKGQEYYGDVCGDTEWKCGMKETCAVCKNVYTDEVWFVVAFLLLGEADGMTQLRITLTCGRYIVNVDQATFLKMHDMYTRDPSTSVYTSTEAASNQAAMDIRTEEESNQAGMDISNRLLEYTDADLERDMAFYQCTIEEADKEEVGIDIGDFDNFNI